MQAIIVSCCGCFHGRTLAVISMSCDNEATREFGPLLPGHLKVDFGDAVALEKIFKGWLNILFQDMVSLVFSIYMSRNLFMYFPYKTILSINFCFAWSWGFVFGVRFILWLVVFMECRAWGPNSWIFVRAHSRRGWGMYEGTEIFY